MEDAGFKSEWWPDVPKVDYNPKPHQLGNDKNRAGSMAMWVAPIRVYYHHLENIHICYFFSSPGNYGGHATKSRKVTIYSIHSSEMSGRSCVGRVVRRSC